MNKHIKQPKVFNTFYINKISHLLYDDDTSRTFAKPENKNDFPYRFRCKDDDGIIYFSGFSKNDSSFSPLDDYGYGCGAATIEYRNPNTGEYEIL